jgi:hypothetical protein
MAGEEGRLSPFRSAPRLLVIASRDHPASDGSNRSEIAPGCTRKRRAAPSAPTVKVSDPYKFDRQDSDNVFRREYSKLIGDSAPSVGYAVVSACMHL